MISDNQLYSLAIFLGSAAMLMIVLYHFLEVNSQDDEGLSVDLQSEKSGVGAVKPPTTLTGAAAGAGGAGDEKR
jgi:oligosaccharyl transferase complex subunit OST4